MTDSRYVVWTDEDVRNAEAIVRKLHDLGYYGLHVNHLCGWIASFRKAPRG